jgi:hypothetical protein
MQVSNIHANTLHGLCLTQVRSLAWLVVYRVMSNCGVLETAAMVEPEMLLRVIYLSGLIPAGDSLRRRSSILENESVRFG